ILAQDGVSQILHRVSFGDPPTRQTHTARVAEPQHQFNALEAAKPQLAFKVRLRAARSKLFHAARTAELGQELPDRSKSFGLDDGLAVELYFGSAHRNSQAKHRPGVRIPKNPRRSEPTTRLRVVQVPGAGLFKFSVSR